MLLGNPNYPALDYSHADVYLNDPLFRASGFGGQYPSAWYTLDEDLSSGHTLGDVLPDNSVMVPGPRPEATIDTTGTGWTAPGSLTFVDVDHEITHSFPPLRNADPGLNELWSAGAEVVGGIHNNTASSEVPYTWSLLAWTPPGTPVPAVTDPNFNNRFSLSNYQGRTSFMAYVGYNFRNADTSRTLVGMTDDLLYRWNRPPQATSADLHALESLLTDAQCATCATRSYFHPSGTALSAHDRLQLLHHNWRVANFVNSPALAEGQYGFPFWGGFSPALSQRAWQNIDGSTKTDIVALPQIVDLQFGALTRDTSFVNARTFRGMTHPMSLAPFSANYWVIRPTGAVAAADRDLVVRISPRGYHRGPATGGLSTDRNRSVRLMASAVAYTIADFGADESLLWNSPGAAVYATDVKWVDCDSLAGDIEIVIPSFGVTRKSAVVVVSLADGPSDQYSGVTEFAYMEAMPYRLDIGVRGDAALSQAPTVVSAIPGHDENWPTWAPAADEVAYSGLDPAVSAYYQVYRRGFDGAAASRVAAMDLNEFTPDWSPRGDRVVFEGRPGTPNESALYAAGVVPGVPPITQLTFQPGCELLPSFQPNGQGIAYYYTLGAGQPWSLRWIGVTGLGDREIAANVSPSGTPPRWTPDGQFVIAYEAPTKRLLRYPVSGGIPQVDPAGALDLEAFDPHPGIGRLATISNVPLANANTDTLFDLFTGLLVPPPPPIATHRVAFQDPSSIPPDTSYRFVERGRQAHGIRWAPDGCRVAYSRSIDGTADRDIYVARTTWNHAPAFATTVGDLGIQACVPFQTFLQATDADGEAVSYRADYLPSGGQFVNGNTFRWQHPSVGDYFVVFRALDGSGGVARKVVKISVIDEGGCGDPLVDGDGGCGACLVAARGSGAASAVSVTAESTSPPVNSYLNGVLPGAWFSQTARADRVVADAAGSLLVGLRATMPGSLVLDRARLEVVDHPADATVLATSAGIVLARPLSLPGLADPSGTDWLAPLATAAADGRALRVPAGTVLQAAWTASDTIVGLAVECARVDGSSGYGAGGVEVQLPQSGSWTTVDRIDPRREFDVLGTLTGDTRGARLVFLQDTQVRSISGFARPAEFEAVGHVLELSPAGSDRPDAPVALAEADGQAVALAQGEAVTLTFPAAAPVQDQTRSYFLALRAAYTPPSGAWLARLHPAGPQLPARFALFQNRPNPFAAGTSFRFDVPHRARVRIELFDALGRRVDTLVDETLEAGSHAYDWDGEDARGALLGPGVYLYRMSAGEFRAQRRLVLLAR